MDGKSSWEEEQPNIEVRLGGLYTLQRISEDSLPDHIRVIETLCAYVRLNASNRMTGVQNNNARQSDIDIQVALKILGERSYERCVYEMNSRVAVDLSTATLPYSNLNSLRFPFTDFGNADLQSATLRHTDLRQAWLGWANFQFADFYKTRLHRAALRGADLRNTNVTRDTLVSAHGVKSGFGKTQLPEGIEPPNHWFAAEEAKDDTEQLRADYFADYWAFVRRDKNAWLIPEKHVQIDEVIVRS